MSPIILILLIILLLGGGGYGYHSFGYLGAGVPGILVILIVLYLFGVF